MEKFDYDFIIIGSGFGGSVSAMRLSEKGYRVAVIEQGRRFRDEDFPKTNWDVRNYLWAPALKCFGIQNMTFFRNIMVLSGVGVGGGSLVYANTLYQPGDEFFSNGVWAGLSDWKKELAPHYDTARRMLGVNRYPITTAADRVMREVAEEMGVGHTYTPTDVGVYFGEPGKTVPDPYFGGKGPARTGCLQCGACMIGCRHGAKNTLVKNYLYFAERAGAEIIPERAVTDLCPVRVDGEDGYEITIENARAWLAKDRRRLRARKVVLSAGVLGTLKLLFHCKNVSKTLPLLSERLGHEVRTNSEALLGVIAKDGPGVDFSKGIAITSSFYPDKHTHVEPVRYPDGSDFMRLLAVPMVDGGNPWLRPVKLLWTAFVKPIETLKLAFARGWARRAVILLVMQTVDNKMRFALGRSPLTLFRRGLVTKPEGGPLAIPTYIPVAHDVARRFAARVGGTPANTFNEVAFDVPSTAHILGGCALAGGPEHGVVDVNQQVFGYPGLYVADGSVIPANLGVNPSLTITAMTERAMSRIPAKSRA